MIYVQYILLNVSVQDKLK